MPDRDRLSALDGAFLDLDTARAPLHVGWVIRFAPAHPAPTPAALRRHLDGRLDRVPRFRRRVVAGPLGSPGRVWADDRGFDVARHVHAVSLPAPGGAAELRALAGALLSVPLDPARPLWRMTLVDGLAGGGFALVGQAHHALIDGMAALQVAALLFDAEPAPAPDPPRPPWQPASAAGLLSGAGGRAASTALAAAHAAAFAARATGRSAGALRRDGAGALRDPAAIVDEAIRPVAGTVLDRSASARREIAFAEVGLDAVRDAGRRLDATVNDILLTACTIALGRALRRHGQTPASLKTLIPVDVRGADDVLGNAISFLFVELPVRLTDPSRILSVIREQTRAAKAAGGAPPVDGLLRHAELVPDAGRRAAARLAARAITFNLVVSNVPGPQVPLYLLGRRVETIVPAVPFLDGHALSIGALSYCGRICVSLYADALVLPEARDIARDLESALDALRLVPAPAASEPAPASEPEPAAEPLVPAGETPWRRRARRRRQSVR